MRLEALKYLYDMQQACRLMDIVRNEVVWGILEKDLPTLIAEVSDLLERGRAEEGAAES